LRFCLFSNSRIDSYSNLYSAQNNGSVWQFSGTPCNGNDGSGWYQIDNNPDMAYIVAGYNTVYEVHKSGSIWQYTGVPCNYNATVCSGWTMLSSSNGEYQASAGSRTGSARRTTEYIHIHLLRRLHACRGQQPADVTRAASSG
jgi:hypothetical protein